MVLYAPTWRGGSHHNPRDTVAELKSIARELRAAFEPSRYTVLLKLHSLTAVHMQGDTEFEAMLVPPLVDTNELLSAVDILITDYSSIFVDFLVTRRPIMFLMDDFEEYVAERGVYLSPEQMPGPVAKNVAELIECLEDPEVACAPFAGAYEQMIATLCPHEDGHATERVLDAVVGGGSGHRVVTDFTHGRKKVLLSVGGFGRSHVTRSAIALANGIDHERYDVSVFTRYVDDEPRASNLDHLDGAVRPLFRVGRMDALFLERVMLDLVNTAGCAFRKTPAPAPRAPVPPRVVPRLRRE